MEWLHTASIMLTVIGCAYYMHRDILSDMKAQTARTDRLYEMFCEAQRENHNRFYELLKDGRK